MTTALGGPAWFASAPDDTGPGLPETLDALTSWIGAVAAEASIDPSATDVVGYSQGAATSLALAFRADAGLRPRAVAAHAAWLANEPGIDWDLASGRDVRVLLTSGTDDEVVPAQQSRSAARALERAGVTVEQFELDAGHELDALPVDHIATWLTASA